tara:strand:- start:3930 stop:4673 length:744 start_codon:yes stop_codon:yes gene_type:complete
MLTKNMKWNRAFGKKVIRSFFTADEIKNIKTEVNALEKKPDKKNYVWKYYEVDGNLNRIEYFVKFNNTLKKLSNSKKVIKEVVELMGEDVILFKDKVNYKYYNGEEFKAHQDITAGWGNYSSKHITFTIPLCDVNEENGGLYFGERQTERLTENYTDLNIEMNYDLVLLKLGDVVLFDSYVPHKSFQNKTQHPRPILFFTYTPKSDGDNYEKYHSDKFKKVPPDINKEVGKMYRSGNTNVAKIFKGE